MKYYAVVKGKNGSGIYSSWEECNNAINKFSGAVYKSFPSIESAKKYLARYGIKNPEIKSCNVMSVVKPRPNIISYKNPLIESRILSLNETVIVYTDGSCSQQGTSSAKAGAGIYFPQFDIKYSSDVPGLQTNNRAEMFAVIMAIEFIVEITGEKIVNIEIHLDSNYVKNNLQSNNKLNLDLWERLISLVNCNNINVKFIKELAHSGVIGNEIADQLAKERSG